MTDKAICGAWAVSREGSLTANRVVGRQLKTAGDSWQVYPFIIDAVHAAVLPLVLFLCMSVLQLC